MKKQRKNKEIEFIKREEKIIEKGWSSSAFNILFAVCAILLTSIFYKNLYLTTLFLLILTTIALFKWKSWITFAVFLVVALTAPLFEMIAIHFGVWHYSLPNVGNVPIWLFVLWGDAGALVYQIALGVKKLGVKK
jgi:hypothetical protein